MCVYWIYIAYIITVCVWSLSHVRLFATPWTAAHQAPLSTGFPRQEYWSGLPFLFPGDLPNPGIEPESLTAPVLAGTLSLTLSHLGSPIILLNNIIYTHTIHLHTHIYIIYEFVLSFLFVGTCYYSACKFFVDYMLWNYVLSVYGWSFNFVYAILYPFKKI